MNASERSLGSLMRTSGIYLAGGLTQQAVGVLLLPLYISVLSPAEYGTLEILNTTGIIVIMVLMLGLPSAIVKCYHQDCRAEHDRQAILATAVAMSLPALLIACGVLIAGSGPIAGLLLGSSEMGTLVVPVALWVVLAGVSQTVLAVFRAREEAGLLTTLTISAVAVAVCLNLWFVYVLRWGVEGILWGNVISTAFTIVAALPALRRRIRAAVEPKLVRPLLGFGLLVAPASIAGWAMNMSDRYVLGYYDQLSSVGVYSLGYKLGMVLEVVVVAPFQLAWPAFAFAISHRSDHRQTYARMLTYLMAVGVLVMLALTHLGYPLLHVIGRADYSPALQVVPVVALAYLFNGVHYCVSPGIHIEGKTKFMPMLFLGSATLNFVLNLLWIPPFGMMGAACATAIAFGALALGTLVVSNVVHPVRYEYNRLFKLCAAGAVAYVLGHLAESGSLLVMVALRSAALVSFPLLLLGFGFMEPREKALLAVVFHGCLARRAGTKPAPVPSFDRT